MLSLWLDASSLGLGLTRPARPDGIILPLLREAGIYLSYDQKRMTKIQEINQSILTTFRAQKTS